MKKEPEVKAWSPSIGDKWQHACHPNIFDCEMTADGIKVTPRNGLPSFTVKDLDTLKQPNMGF